MIAKELG